ncbi:MAG: hypothetical protein EH225_11705 [Calditrichaeota bacterium]|nr:hypothetical protein [Calditrichota bacterium]RQV92499.1 MAG: hypothetical protein EH221_11360 [bacterium]RQV99355.1 MAG: hypothetical protein EH225_11705 [Calditrichota bacterium]
MKQLHFDFRDIFRAPRLAFSIQRIWINGTGLLGGYVAYLIISYIALIIGGYSFSEIWKQSALLPCAFIMAVPWYSTILYLLGVIVLGAVILLTNTAVSRVIYMTLRDELFYTWTQAFKFAFKKWISSLGSIITFLFIIAFFVIGALVMGLIGRIPFIGELGTALLTVPYIFGALLLLFILIAFMIALFFVPAIIATSDEDALGGVFQSFSITFNQPWRIVVYSMFLSVLYIVGVFIFVLALKAAYSIFIFLFTIGMGDKILQIQEQALYIIDQSLPALYSWVQHLPGESGNWIYLTSQHPFPPQLNGVMTLAGYIMGIFLLFFGGVVVAYGEAIYNAGLTIIYIILYKLQEKESLLEREDEELKEEEEEEEKTETTEETVPPVETETKTKPKKPGRKPSAKSKKPRKKE